MNLRALDPEPYGFARCGGTHLGLCPYVARGTSHVCWPCASQAIFPPPVRSCPTCAHPLTDEEPQCRNHLCQTDQDRYYRRAFAIGLYRDPLGSAIRAYKTRHGWAIIFARILVGWLDARLLDQQAPEWDLILAMPSAPQERGRDFSPGHRILRLAHDEDAFYPFDVADPAAVIKTRATPRMRGRSAVDRAAIAEREIYPALHVPDAGRVAGRTVLVVDDVFTSGHSLNQVARRLTEGGASAVDVLAFARRMRSWANRMPWPRGRPRGQGE